MHPERLAHGIANEIIDYFVVPQAEKIDAKIFDALIQINKAHVLMLKEQRIISKFEAARILGALLEVEEQGVENFKINPALGDLYMTIEAYVIDRIGEAVGGKMHTGRSRNDLFQAALHFALARKIHEIEVETIHFRHILLNLAESHAGTIMPGYTHTQHAQPITFGHYLLACFDAATRDFDRLEDSYRRINLSPLGAAALAGTGFPIDRQRTSDLLGFSGLLENSLDAISEKDDVAEVLSVLAILATNLSRFANDLVYWSSLEFGMVEIADEYCTSSSIMPQKKNPWAPEIVRAYSMNIAGNLFKVLAILKGLPIGLNMDLDVLEAAVWDSVDLTVGVIRIMSGVVRTLTVRKEIMERLSSEGFMTATELADTLVRKKMISFRTAHRIVGLLARRMIERRLSVLDITNTMLDECSVEITGKPLGISNEDLRNALDPRVNLELRKTIGGPAPAETRRMVRQRKRRLTKDRLMLREEEDRMTKAAVRLRKTVNTICT